MFVAEKNTTHKMVLCGLLTLCLSLFAGALPAWANNPPAAPCGLPYEGEIVESATYTITSDCDTSGHLVVTNQAEVTIISSGGYRYRIAISSGKVHVRLVGAGQDSTTVTYDRGTLIYNPTQERSQPADCFQNLEAIGLICRIPGPNPTLEIYGITSNSEGVFLLRVTQTDVDSVPLGSFVASTEDGHVAVRRGKDSHVIISMGPNDEGKVHHVTLEDDINGRVIGTVDTFGGPPGAPATSASPDTLIIIVPILVKPQTSQEDGTIIHIVLPGESTFQIAKAYGVSMNVIVERNQLANRGRVIQPGQELVIPGAVVLVDPDPSTTEPTTIPIHQENCPETQYIIREGQIIHIVLLGENLYNIAEAYGVDLDDIVALNQLPNRGRVLQPGQKLVIRAATPAEESNAASTEDSCPETPPESAADPIIHVVRPGDTMYSIAQIYGLSIDEIVALNQLPNRGRLIFPGQELIIREATTPVAAENDE